MTSLNRSDTSAARRFQLRTGDLCSVAGRISSVFDSLNALEAEHQARERARKDGSSGYEESYLKEDPDVGDDFGNKPSPTSDGVFKRPWSAPCGPSKRSCPRGAFRSSSAGRSSASTTPDYKVHPERWTRYTLDSVSEDDMSEASNTTAALDYLHERRLQRERESRDDEDRIVVDSGGDAPAVGRHVFQKRTWDGDADMEDATAEPSSSSSYRIGTGKLVMPECVVGMKPSVAKKASPDGGGRQRSTSLPAVSSSSLISFDCADYDDDPDKLVVDDAEEEAAEVASSAAWRDAVKKGRKLRARTDEEVD
ncbi:uncharacterized protein [Dermacentor andersoni]|uniref:uncharacterized protein n=1 Tax=Dermacentor andersoni TaxID=34620 RepID=UPI0021558F59|nr:uncharacterized protein LOC126539263 [Dermacentor andersoni]